MRFKRTRFRGNEPLNGLREEKYPAASRVLEEQETELQEFEGPDGLNELQEESTGLEDEVQEEAGEVEYSEYDELDSWEEASPAGSDNPETVALEVDEKEISQATFSSDVEEQEDTEKEDVVEEPGYADQQGEIKEQSEPVEEQDEAGEQGQAEEPDTQATWGGVPDTGPRFTEPSVLSKPVERPAINIRYSGR